MNKLTKIKHLLELEGRDSSLGLGIYLLASVLAYSKYKIHEKKSYRFYVKNLKIV